MSTLCAAGTAIGGRYRLLSRIAGGGMGEVWRAHDEALDRPVAVKLLRPEYADDGPFLARFRAEARLAGTVRSPRVAAVLDYGERGYGPVGSRAPYLVLELVDGESVHSRLARYGSLDAATTALVLAQTAEALTDAHAAGVVHRDVKPGNLLLTSDGRVKVTDFGIARALGDAGMTRTGEVVGTAHYLAPEQVRGREAEPASDVYALGVVGFECLAGQRPFTGANQVAVALARLTEDPPTLPSSVPAGLSALVADMLAREPDERPADRDVARRAWRLAVDLSTAAHARHTSGLVAIGGAGGGAVDAQAHGDAGSGTTRLSPSRPRRRHRRGLEAHPRRAGLLAGAGVAGAALLGAAGALTGSIVPGSSRQEPGTGGDSSPALHRPASTGSLAVSTAGADTSAGGALRTATVGAVAASPSPLAASALHPLATPTGPASGGSRAPAGPGDAPPGAATRAGTNGAGAKGAKRSKAPGGGKHKGKGVGKGGRG